MLFDENLGFVTYNIPGNKLTVTKLTSLEDGFSKGNMFQEIYKPYKNYTVKKVSATNKKDALLLEIMSLSFAINDLGLYLDLHPSDTEMLKKFKSYVEKSCEKEMEYVKNYGPLELIDNDDANYFAWIKNPWPWENEGGTKYV